MFESVQAKYLAYPSFVIILLILANIIRMAVGGKPTVLTWIAVVISAFFAILYLGLGVFNVNCLVMGGCGVWAWIVWALALFKLLALAVLLVVLLVAPLDKLRSKQEEEPKQITTPATPATSAPSTQTPPTPVTTSPSS